MVEWYTKQAASSKLIENIKFHYDLKKYMNIKKEKNKA